MKLLPSSLVTFLLTTPSLILSSSLSKSRSDFFNDVLNPLSTQNYCKPTGQIEDLCCDFETVEDTNHLLFKNLHHLVTNDYFRFYKVDLFKECPFWSEDGSCMNQACAVDTTDENDDHIPEAWRSKKLSALNQTTNPTNAETVEVKKDDQSSFCVLEDEEDSDGQFIDLLSNPERFTGYSGSSSSRVWKAIYEENCFSHVGFIDPSEKETTGWAPLSLSLSGGGISSLAGPRDEGDEVCLEKRVFYRLISGLHASISIHICDDYLDQKTGEWSPNLPCFITRIGQHPERLQNVYFTYVVALRALSKSGPILEKTLRQTGATDEEVGKLRELVKISQGCEEGFEEGRMFRGVGAQVLKQEFRSHFRNISAIMDCVGCDKCRLWGKLQITGLGTALKLLFSEEGENEVLSRSEVVSFLNGLHRISESLEAVDRFRSLWGKKEVGEEEDEERRWVEERFEEEVELEGEGEGNASSIPVATGVGSGSGEGVLPIAWNWCREGWRVCWERVGDVLGGR